MVPVQPCQRFPRIRAWHLQHDVRITPPTRSRIAMAVRARPRRSPSVSLLQTQSIRPTTDLPPLQRSRYPTPTSWTTTVVSSG
jgi:hypothetical protein